MTETPPRVETQRAAGPSVGSVIYRGLEALASLKLTVVLFALSMVLVFVGTLAQMDANIWSVVTDYFRSFYVWVPAQLFVRLGQVFIGLPTSMVAPSWLGFPFPGGWTIGFLLLLNLLAAHAIRFRMTWKRSGIMILHVGVIMLLVGELLTGIFQVEQKMTIAEGETVNFSDRSAPPAVELVFSRAISTNEVEEIIVPQGQLTTDGRRVSAERLPCDLIIDSYAKNSKLRDGTGPSALTASDGNSYLAAGHQEESGVDTTAGENIPAVSLRFAKKGGSEELGAGTFSVWYYGNTTRQMQLKTPIQFPPQELTVDGVAYRVELRPVREVKPFNIRLLEFKHELYIGTERPKNFSSLIRLQDPELGIDREMLIYMNSPMRYRGEAFFQSGWLPGDKGTILHVVRNPAADLNYWACGAVALGMLIHFGIHLIGFLKRRAVA